MRILIFCLLMTFGIASGCGPSEDQPTPQQGAQLDTLRQATIKQLETMFGRSLTDQEKQCVVVKLKNGNLDSYVAPSLSETVRQWSQRMQTKPS
jgi:hypothetical protein